jgi:hypothetical protein
VFIGRLDDAIASHHPRNTQVYNFFDYLLPLQGIFGGGRD